MQLPVYSFYKMELFVLFFAPVVAVISLLIVMAVFSTLIAWLMFLCSSSKYAVYGMTEALGEELKKLGKPGVKTTVVCPVFVNTGLCMFPKDRSVCPMFVNTGLCMFPKDRSVCPMFVNTGLCMFPKDRSVCPMFVNTGLCMFAKGMGTVEPTFRGTGLLPK